MSIIEVNCLTKEFTYYEKELGLKNSIKNLFQRKELLFSFWFIKADSIAEVTDSFWDFNNVPMVVYNRVVQRAGIFFFPIFVITNFPGLFVLGRMNKVYIAWGIIAPFLFLGLTRIFWSAAVRNYTSASS